MLHLRPHHHFPSVTLSVLAGAGCPVNMLGETDYPWWKDYRNNKYRQRDTMTMEKIIRKSFLQCLKEYTNNSSIGGLKEMCAPNLTWLQRTIRILTFALMSGLVVYFLYYTWFGTLSNPLIVTSESSTYPIADIDFPAVALCNVNRISKKALKELAISMHPLVAQNNETLEEMEDFILQAGRLLDFSYNRVWGKGHVFLDYLASNQYNTRDTIDHMKKLAPNCSEMLLRCAWGGQRVECSSVFETRRTGRGHCCIFNYVLDYDSALSPKRAAIKEVKRQKLPGHMHGLNVVLDPLMDDYAYPLNNFRGFDVLLFAPTHFADLSAGRMIHRLSEPNHASFMELTSIRQVASPEVRKYPLKSRKCLFHDEAGKFNQMYSYSACIVKCRIKTVQSLCKCTPYFMPTGDRGRVCTMDDLQCLNKYKEKLLYLYPMNTDITEGLEVELQDSLFCPDCLPDCELTQHFTNSYNIPIDVLGEKIYYVDTFVEGINMTNKCLLNIYHARSDGVLERLDVVAYWFEILSNFGGFGGVLIGISVISIVEIIYHLFIRFAMLIHNNYTLYH